MRKNYKEKINLFELAERGEVIIKFFAETSTSDYNKLPLSLQQAIEFIYDCLKGDDNNETNKI